MPGWNCLNAIKHAFRPLNSAPPFSMTSSSSSTVSTTRSVASSRPPMRQEVSYSPRIPYGLANNREYWSAWNTDCSVFSAIARTCRDISSDSCSPCLRIADRRPIAWRICFSRRRAPRGAFPRFPSNSVCRTSNVVRARPSSCWTTL